MARLLIAISLLVTGGCTPEVVLPKTYPVTGTVTYPGGKAMSGGTVQFNSSTDPLLRIMGPIDKDGKFTLTTVKDTARADGAPEGEYKVFVLPPMVSDARDKVPEGHKGVAPIVLSQPYKIEARENTIKLELPAGTK